MKKAFTAVILLSVLAPAAAALSIDNPLLAPLYSIDPARDISGSDDTFRLRTAIDPDPFYAFAMSAIVPGSGQFVYGSTLKGGIFLGLETVLAGGSYVLYHRGNLKTDDFMDYAVTNAEAYSNGSDEYFEHVGNWRASGTLVEDVEGFAEVRFDEEEYGYKTYNMYVWERLYSEYRFPVEPEGGWTGGLEDIPEEDRLDMYEDFLDDAWSEDKGWEWTDQQALNTYIDKRADANSYYKNATFLLSAVIVNHCISAIDAARTASNRRYIDDDGLSMQVLPDRIDPKVFLQWKTRF